MARAQETVVETLQFLEELEEQHRGTSRERRARMLRTLKQRPAVSFADLQKEIGCSERSLQRWWELYRAGGLAALLGTENRRRGKPRRIDETALQGLREKLKFEGFSRLSEVQEWLETAHGVSYSRSGVWNLLRSSTDAAPRGWRLLHDFGETHPSEPAADESPQSTGVSNQVIHFLNALPTSSDSREWIMQFREALRGLLGDVDRASVNVNLDCSLSDPHAYNPKLVISHRVGHDMDSDPDVVVSRTESTPSQRLLEGVRQQGFPMADYHAPQMLDYYYADTAYLGTIILWRNIEKEPISAGSISLLGALRPFIVFLLSDLVARHQADRPIDRVFHDALGFLVDDAKLSPQEERVVILQLMGHSYKEMADVLNVTVDTVKKHFKQIHRKTGTRGQAELFAKYFTSRLIPETLREFGDADR